MRDTIPWSSERLYDRSGNCIDPLCPGSIDDDRYCDHARCEYSGVRGTRCIKPNGHFDDCEYLQHAGDRARDRRIIQLTSMTILSRLPHQFNLRSAALRASDYDQIISAADDAAPRRER